MLPRQIRLTYYDQVAEALSHKTFGEIRALLVEFDLRPADPHDGWGGGFDSPGEYLKEHLSQLDDGSLLELLEYSGGRAASGPLSWDQGYTRVFLSHLASEKSTANEVVKVLERHGFTGFVAHTAITPSASWRNTIEDHLASADVLVAMVHDGFYESAWTEQEVGWALGADVPVLSLLFENGPGLRGFMESRQAIKVGERALDVVGREIAVACTRIDALRDRVRAGAFKRLVEARNFYDTRDAATLLWEQCQGLNWSEAEQLQQAMTQNDQIAGFREGTQAVRNLIDSAEPSPDEEPF